MNLARNGNCLVLALLTMNVSTATAGDEMGVVGFRPHAQELRAPVGAPIGVLFDRPVDRSTVNGTTFWAFGRWSGKVEGQLRFWLQDHLVALVPDTPLAHGERIMVIIADDILGTDGTPLRSGGMSWQYWTRSNPNPFPLQPHAVLSTRTTASQSTRAYGGVGTDMNNDGYLDLTIVNEDTADLRVFLNTADGSGSFSDFMIPTTPVNDRASPNEPSDFNRDGNADLAVANINTDTISILLGNGDGTFAPQQEVAVGDQPRGLVVLDVDGDGDTDIVTTNSGGPSAFALLVNDGQGLFGPAQFFGPDGRDEWALAAADMNGDQLLDLVSGRQSFGAPMISVWAANGDGTFTLASSTNPGGAVWMLATGDVNADGFEDVVAVANNNNAGVLLTGDGAGGLNAPVSVSTDPFPLATDLGDIDGDGDLDWLTSSFSGDWFLFRNDGAGNYGLPTEINAPQAASCALILDIDNDGDNDLALIDELADVIHLYTH